MQRESQSSSLKQSRALLFSFVLGVTSAFGADVTPAKTEAPAVQASSSHAEALAAIAAAIENGAIKKGETTIDGFRKLFAGVDFGKETVDELVVLSAPMFFSKPWTTPPSPIIPGFDPPHPYPWRPRFVIEAAFTSDSRLKEFNLRLMQGKFE